MRLRVIAFSIAFALSTSARPRIVSERNFELGRSTVEERAKEDPQSSLSKFERFLHGLHHALTQPI